ncbi:MAG: hypothetical protein FWE68_06875, partial [Defluviitaleaceae bacterium]|nr:hypothetical protein [Defluviitaleaceae bacterium]
MNLYTYCANDPVNRWDPSGHAWYHWVIGAAVDAVAVAAVVVTAGGALPALYAIGSVASGVAVLTTAATVAAGVAIGAAVTYGFMAGDAA